MTEAIEQRSNEGMAKIPTKKVTIDVPDLEYDTLKELAEEKGTSIRGLVREGVDLVIIDNKELLTQMDKKTNEAAKEKSNKIREILSKLDKQ